MPRQIGIPISRANAQPVKGCAQKCQQDHRQRPLVNDRHGQSHVLGIKKQDQGRERRDRLRSLAGSDSLPKSLFALVGLALTANSLFGAKVRNQLLRLPDICIFLVRPFFTEAFCQG